ncbi:MAG: CRISPR system precrRNA processing endoribonuclease RAMP protein Cas6 [Syntrophobacterales bacterium]|nr:CRISPR system precrRNA processing endoribonuclease RAMP protein Cas6 [Syntrophobacterales bacterium]
MRFGCYRFTARFLDDARLPEYKGSTFRGVFGHALRSVVCALKRCTCTDCLLSSRCLYPFIFETSPVSGGGETGDTVFSRRRISSRPHPYVIEPLAGEQTRYRAGEIFTFNLLLFGRANDSLPYFIYAFSEVGRSGIGSKTKGQGARFSLVSVSSQDQILYDGAENRMYPREVTEDLGALLRPLNGKADSGEPAGGGVSTDSRITLELLTPLRLKYGNHFHGASLPFHVLVRAALRRVSSLCLYHGAGEPELDYRGLVARSQAVQADEESLYWFDWERYSSRQDQKMLMGGLMGRVHYTGDLDEFLPLLRFCEQVHLGKQTTFGLGHIRLKHS